MFLLTTTTDNGKVAMEKLRSSLHEFNPGPVHQFSENEFQLNWFSVKPADNLHVYKNGYVVGKIAFEEACSPDPMVHQENMPDRTNTLLINVQIERDGKGWKIKPNQSTCIFYSKNSISDMQLLIADNCQYTPDMMHFAILASVGYFPGNLTLFEEIQKIPFLHALLLPGFELKREEEYRKNLPNDGKMIERLVDVLPKVQKTYLGLSGGMDSRFVLGVLLKAGITPELITQKGDEIDIAAKVASKLNLKHSLALSPPLAPQMYTIMTDGLIYYKGGTYSRLRDAIDKDSVFHFGLSAGAIIENTMKTAWKRPGNKSNIYDDLIFYGLLNYAPNQFNGLAKRYSKQDVLAYLKKNLAFGKEYTDFKGGKQWSSWFYHLHRALRWCGDHTADLSFYTYPVLILRDLEAVSYGIPTSAYENFYKDRLRKMNQKLMPNLDIAYSQNRPVKMLPLVVRDFNKIYYEFFKRFLARFQAKKKVSLTKSAGGEKLKFYNEVDLEDTVNPNFKNYIRKNLKELVLDETVSKNEKRAAVTLHHVLNYIQGKH